ncbi:senecionine N-oxygenase-like isoform X3 [Plodia interpunctella]|uniref:senecionine N-oxygenase-like isoform X3 n=1 Tax=Plodia interpunctella TaxID=58824 RepID=UPI00236863BD|nr:senecionine N-oxygenase-like isoform X2 [Plodia interpunctella]
MHFGITKISNPRVCVIGAGIAGLTSARYLKEAGINFTVLEATRYVGGTWRYDPRVDVDENGLTLFTSMYKHLRTNLPKPAMEMPGYPLPAEMPSYPTWEQFYKYLQSYSKHFDLEKHIKFLHHVISVKRDENVWRVKHKQVVTKEEYEEEYDFVVVGTGHYSKPHMPSIPGEEKFKGTIIHSHNYRLPDPFKNRRILFIGAGPSGMDISLDVAEVATRVVHSHHSIANFKTPFPENYVRKPDVRELNETGVTFVDDTFEEIDDIVYCTGYEYHYPFLDESSGLTFAPHSVVPLYKYLVNVNQPTMVIMGLVVRACLVIAIDAQARYTTALVKGNFSQPSRDEMMAEWQNRYDSLKSQGRPLSHIHLLDKKEDEYYADLTKESGIERVPPVMFKIRTHDAKSKLENLLIYRNYSYEVLDSENFTVSLEKSRNKTEVTAKEATMWS